MGKYWHIWKLQAQETLEYHWSVILYRLSNLFSLVVIIALWFASKTNSTDIGGYTLNELITYYLISMVLSGFVFWFPTGSIKEEISEGLINMKTLIKPVSYYWQNFFQEIGWHSISPVFSFIPVVLVIILLRTNLVGNFTLEVLIPFIISAFLSAMVCFNMSYCFGLLAFWLTEVAEITSLMWIGVSIFGGQAIPISFFPSGFREIINLLPFRFMFSFPMEIYLKKTTGIEVVIGFVMQLFWVTTFAVLSRFMWAKGLKRYSAFGG